MADQLNNFGVDANGKSYMLLRRETIKMAPLGVDKSKILASIDYQQLISLALQKNAIGPSAPLPTQSGTDKVPNSVVQVYKTLGHVQQQLQTNFSYPIQDFTQAARNMQRFTRDIQGVAFQANQVWQDANTAYVEAKKAWNTIANIPDALSKLFGGDQPKDKGDALNYPDKGDNENYFDRVRLPWSITTVERRLKNLDPSEGDSYAPIQFFVNPSKIRYSLSYVESLELVQKGQMLTSWVKPGVRSRFPALKITFTFQSSNILAERYSESVLGSETVPTDIEPPNYLADTKTISNIRSTTYHTPPGVKNFYDLMDILNAPRIIDVNELDLNQANSDQYDGQPNYAILKISTRLFPLLTLEGFFTGNLDFGEDAQDPLKFEAELSFIAFNSDPPWWDSDLIQQRYDDFYKYWVEEALHIDVSQISISGMDYQDRLNEASALDTELKNFSTASNIPVEILSYAANDVSASYGTNVVGTTTNVNLAPDSLESLNPLSSSTTDGSLPLDQLSQLTPGIPG